MHTHIFSAVDRSYTFSNKILDLLIICESEGKIPDAFASSLRGEVEDAGAAKWAGVITEEELSDFHQGRCISFLVSLSQPTQMDCVCGDTAAMTLESVLSLELPFYVNLPFRAWRQSQ